MAAPVVESTASASDLASSLTVSKPSGTAEDDLLWAWTASSSDFTSGPSGWTEETSLETTQSSLRLQAWSKVAGGSEPTSYTWTASGSSRVAGIVERISGADGTTYVGQTSTNNGSSATMRASGLSSLATDSLVLSAHYCSFSFENGGPSSGWTEDDRIVNLLELIACSDDPAGTTTTDNDYTDAFAGDFIGLQVEILTASGGAYTITADGGSYSLTGTAATLTYEGGGTTPGQRFVRRHDAARSSTSNTTAADITYDTAVFSEGGYSWASPEVTVDTVGLYLNIFDTGQNQLASTRAVGTLVPSVNTTDQARFRARHRYLRNSGGNHGASIGMAILNLAANDDVKVRNPGALTPTDAVGNYATNASYGGALQLLRLPAGNLTHVERTADAAEVGTSNINTTRPWLDSSGTWTTVTFNSEVQDDDSLYAGSGGDITLAANTKYLIVWGGNCYSTDASRHTYVMRLRINSLNVQSGTGYQRNTASQGPPMNGMYLHETGGSTETLNLQATHEIEGGDAGTPNVADAYVQVLELPSSAEWIHVDNSTTDSLTAALAGTSTWYDTPLSSTLRADGDSNLSLDAANDAVQNDSGASLPILAIGWHRWDRDSGSSGTRKMPWTRWDNGGAAVGYGVAGAFSRGQQSSDDTWQAHYCSAALMDLANGADLSFQVNEPASGANSDMGVYASTSRYFLGVQVLNLNTLDAGGGAYTLTADAGVYSLTGQAANLEFGAAVDADAGAYALTGQDVILSYGTTLDAEAGAYAYAGTSADLLYGAVLGASGGSYTLAGDAAGLLFGSVVGADSGSYTLTGTDADLNYGIVLIAESGNYALTGADADLLAARLLSADAGSYALTGQNAGLNYGTILNAEGGSYSLTGQDAAFLRGLLLEAEAGAYTLTGTDVALQYGSNTVLAAETGAYTVSGSDAALLFNRALDAGAGSYSLTGQDAVLTLGASSSEGRIWLLRRRRRK